jgi:predicted permease
VSETPRPDPALGGGGGAQAEPPDGGGRARRFEEEDADWRRRRTREIRAELADHVERRAAALMAAGYTKEGARAEAERRLGNASRVEEACMRIAERRRSRLRLAGWLEDTARDVRVAVRAYRRRPVLAGGVMLTIALAIGAATAVFSVVRGVLLAPLSYPRAHELYSVYTRYLPATGYDFEYFTISGPELVEYRAMTRAMAGVAAYGVGTMNLTPSAGEPERVGVLQATADLFDVLDVRAAMGRTFVAADGAAAAPCVAVLSHGLWLDRFGGAGVVGSDVRLNGRPCAIVGVMPAGFAFPDERTRLYLVQKLDPTNAGWERESHPFVAVARLAEGVPLAAAQSELDALRARWAAEFPEHHARGHFIVLRPLADDITGDVRTPLLVLLGAVGLVLLIVTVNVASLILAGAEARRKEFAVRAALGVARARLLRQLMTESLLLALLGGALGVLLSRWLLRALLALYPGRLPRAGEVRIDGTVLLFGIGIAVASGLLFGAFPAIRFSAVRVADVLRTAGRGLTPHAGGVRVRRAFVVAQTALALVLALGAVLLARSYERMRAIDLGFEPAGVLTFPVAVPSGSYPDGARARDYFLRLEARLAAVAGVAAVGAVSDLPLRSGGGADDFIIEGRVLPAPGQAAWNARYQMATPGARAALGLDIVAGRWLAPTDVAGGPPVAVINEAFARAYYAGEEAVGRRIRYYGADSAWITIVGVVQDVRQLGVTTDAPPAIYTSLVQAPRPAYEGRMMNLLVRFGTDPLAGAAAVRAAASELDPTLPLGPLTTLDDVVTESVGGSRFTTTLMSAFAVLALLLGAIGVYGVLAHTVSLRAHEIGIRLTLGADRRDVLTRTVWQGMALVVAGIAVGFVVTFALRAAVEGLLFGVQPFDPLSLGFAAGTLLLVSLVACSLPAWRAARIDPLAALRQE